MLAGNAYDRLKCISMLLELLYQRGHLYGLRAGSENKHYLFHKLFLKGSAEVYYLDIVAIIKLGKLSVINEKSHNICLLICLLISCKLEHIMFRYIRFDNKNLSIVAALHDLVDDTFGG